MSKLAGKIAVVTGGSAGIGRGIATHFVREGARVFITGRNQAGLDKAVAEIGGTISAVRGDASNLADIDRIYQTVREKAGRIDVLVVNAGFYEVGTLGEITEEHFDKTFNTNVRGVLFAVQKALPLLGRGSSVILIGSVASIKGFPSFSVYDATKAAVRSFARGWILDLEGARYPHQCAEPRAHRHSRPRGADERRAEGGGRIPRTAGPPRDARRHG